METCSPAICSSPHASSWSSGAATPTAAIGSTTSDNIPSANYYGEKLKATISNSACIEEDIEPVSDPCAQSDLTPPRQQGAITHKLKQLLDHLSINPSMTLENSGSVARDHLASERTFLAYVRTSLALASTGVALVQLFAISEMSSASRDENSSTKEVGGPRKLQQFGKPLGVTTIVLALMMLLMGESAMTG